MRVIVLNYETGTYLQGKYHGQICPRGVLLPCDFSSPGTLAAQCGSGAAFVLSPENKVKF